MSRAFQETNVGEEDPGEIRTKGEQDGGEGRCRQIALKEGPLPKPTASSAPWKPRRVYWRSRRTDDPKALFKTMAAKSLKTSAGGQTPHAMLYAAMIREINVKGDAARFTKVERGQFALSNGAKAADAAE